MIKLFNDKTEKKINMKISSLTTNYTKELMILYFSFYSWRETTKIKVKTDEISTQLRFM